MKIQYNGGNEFSDSLPADGWTLSNKMWKNTEEESNVYCTKCGKELKDGDRFCWNCGAQVTSTGQAGETAEGEVKRAVSIEKRVEEKTEEKAHIVGVRLKKDTGEDKDGKVEGLSAGLDEDGMYDYKSLPTEEPQGIHKIYIIDFMTRMMEKSNVPLFIYLLINVVIIGVFAMAFFMLPPVWGIVAGLLLYIASVSIALSPVGEWLLRRQTGCTKIVEKDIIDRLEPIFREVYYKAKQKNPAISSDVRLFINDDKAPNAFATGRKTVCVTRGLLDMTDDQIRATLGHEFGHLSHKDTDRILVVSVGNTVITGILILFQIGIIISDFIMQIVAIIQGDEEGFMMSVFSSIARVVSLVVVRGFMKVWSMLGVALCMKTSRGNEYMADEFAYDLGFGTGLCSMLASLGLGGRPSGLFANLASSHPASEDRIARLRALEETKRITG